MPPVTRIGDADIIHCEVPYRLEGSPNVLCNDIPISRQGDLNTPHAGPVCVTHQAPITIGSRTVFINDRGCGRIGDAITNCTVVAEGSPNVIAGG